MSLVSFETWDQIWPIKKSNHSGAPNHPTEIVIKNICYVVYD